MQPRRRAHLFAVATAIVLATARPATALLWTDPPGTLADVVAAADRIFRGRVLSLTHGTAQGPVGQSIPYTAASIAVEAAFRGTSIGAVELVHVLGGPFPGPGNRKLWVPGLPSFAVGDRVVAFTNQATFPFAGAVWGTHGVLRVASTVENPPMTLTDTWQPVTVVGDRLVARVDVRCLLAPKRRDLCARWIPTRLPPGTSPPSVALPKDAATLSRVEELLSTLVRTAGPPKSGGVRLTKPEQVEPPIATWMRHGGKP